MSLIKIFKSAISLDTNDINYYYSSEKFGAFYLPFASERKKGILLRIAIFFNLFLKALLNSLTSRANLSSPQSGSLLFISWTKNQKDSLHDICEGLTNSCLVDQSYGKPSAYPICKAYLLSLPFFPLVLFNWIRSSGYQRKSYQYAFDKYWLSYGHYLATVLWFIKIKPRVVIVSNDHNMVCRATLSAAKFLGIPTVYIQHASITEKFPSLDVDYALLEGIDTLEKYEKIGVSDSKVYLIGMPKLDKYMKFLNTSKSVKTLGVCVNKLDSFEEVSRLVDSIRLRIPEISIIFRPHPADTEKFFLWKRLSEKYSLQYSDPTVEDSFYFLSRIDAIVAGDSNILLEAVLLDVYPLYFSFSDYCRDYYGFVKHGVVKHYANENELIDRLVELKKQKPGVREKAKRYCHVIGTVNDGKSVTMAAKLIENISTNGSDSDWKRMTTYHIPTFELP